jgi:hypothetical protein
MVKSKKISPEKKEHHPMLFQNTPRVDFKTMILVAES